MSNPNGNYSISVKLESKINVYINQTECYLNEDFII